jgi:hypothetical protein
MYEPCPKCGSKYAIMDYGGCESTSCGLFCQDCNYAVRGRDVELVQDKWRAASIKAGKFDPNDEEY